MPEHRTLARAPITEMLVDFQVKVREDFDVLQFFNYITEKTLEAFE